MIVLTSKGKIEILAPCGSFAALTAAVRSGADAVYLGLDRFSARAFADNFDEYTLARAVRYCRLHGVKVHTAVNTLVSDDELEGALKAAQSAYEAGVDAFIVQDLGLAALIKKACPGAELHASTQLTVHTPEGARFLYENGFDRVVLAREMSRQEIAGVVKSCPVQTEVFVHGALCMCVSGQCYLSAMLGGRSGNRGRCAQPCRLPFSVKGGTGHDLSLKDNCIINSLKELEELGVTSAKIEGRMKRPEYVAAAVSACREAADSGRADDESLDRLRSVFSRSGFTDGYYTGRLGREMFGTRSKDDVTAATDKLLARIRTEYKDEAQSRDVSFTLIIEYGKPSKLTAESGGKTVTVTGDLPQKAQKVALSAEKAQAQLSKTGGTAFRAAEVKARLGEGLTLPASEINAMRRGALEKLTALFEQPPERKREDVLIPAVKPYRKSGKTALRACFKSCFVPEDFKECELVFVPLFSDIGEIARLKESGFNVGVKVPRVIFGGEEAAEKVLLDAKAAGVTDAWCGNIGTAALALRLGMSVHGGFSLNVFNSQSLDFLEKAGLEDTEVSIELTAKQIARLGGTIRRGVAAYGHLPLMITRNCPNKNGSGCSKCGGRSTITDRRGTQFTLMCEGGCTELLNSDALVLSDKLDDFACADFLTLCFTYETPEECVRILDMYRSGGKSGGNLTRGLYYRGVE